MARLTTRLAGISLLAITLACSGTWSQFKDDTAVQFIAQRDDAGTPDWETAVAGIVTATYDHDESGLIDSRSELERIPCGMFRTLDAALRTLGRPGLAIQYKLVAPSTDFRGHRLGFSPLVQEPLVDRIAACTEAPEKVMSDPSDG